MFSLIKAVSTLFRCPQADAQHRHENYLSQAGQTLDEQLPT
jgi:hypothetical protein